MFKVGDLVRVNDTGTSRYGSIGTVIEVRDEPETWNTDIRIGDDEIAFAEEELEPVLVPVSDVFNAVSNPEHYSKGMPEGVGVIDIIRAQNVEYIRGKIIKYILRWKYKNGVKDLRKAQQYLTWLIEAQENALPEWRDGTDD